MGSNKKLTIGFYSPYFSMMGGGERYLLTLAKLFCTKYDVSVIVDPSLLKLIDKNFGITAGKLEIIHPFQFLSIDSLQRFNFLKRFDVFFYTTDGSVFFSASRKNFLVIQSPVHIPVRGLFNTPKMWNWQPLCYSVFMKDIIQKRLVREALVVPPSVDEAFFTQSATKKRNTILTVGRFFPQPHSKRQEVLVEVFASFAERALPGWKLVIAGGLTEEEGNALVSNLRAKIIGLPIELKVNISFKELVTLYQEAKIYWHAAGYNQDIQKYPERAEHFGITTLEAMAGGAVPIVYPAGGQTELVYEGKNGFYWRSAKELIEKTAQLAQDEKLRESIAKKAREQAAQFSLASLRSSYEKLLA